MSRISHSKIIKTKIRLVVVEIYQYDQLQGESASKQILTALVMTHIS